MKLAKCFQYRFPVIGATFIRSNRTAKFWTILRIRDQCNKFHSSVTEMKLNWSSDNWFGIYQWRAIRNYHEIDEGTFEWNSHRKMQHISVQNQAPVSSMASFPSFVGSKTHKNHLLSDQKLSSSVFQLFFSPLIQEQNDRYHLFHSKL